MEEEQQQGGRVCVQSVCVCLHQQQEDDDTTFYFTAKYIAQGAAVVERERVCACARLWAVVVDRPSKAEVVCLLCPCCVCGGDPFSPVAPAVEAVQAQQQWQLGREPSHLYPLKYAWQRQQRQQQQGVLCRRAVVMT